MKKEFMDESTQTLNELRKKVTNMKLTNPEVASNFSDALDKIEQELVLLEDDKGYESTADLQAISNLATLEVEINNYLQTGRISSVPVLAISDEDTPSGKELEKRHMLSVYAKLAEITSQMPDVSIDKIKKMRARWDEIKSTFSPVEQSVVEKNLAAAFLNYQTQYIKNNEEFPTDEIQAYCDINQYESLFKQKIIDKINLMHEDTPERLELEIDMFSWDFQKALGSTLKWKALTGVALDIDKEMVDKALSIPEEKIKEEKKVEEPKKEEKEERWDSGIDKSNLMIDPSKDDPTGPSALIVYRIPKSDGSFKIKQKLVRCDDKGRFRLFFNKEHVAEIYFLEGIKQLRFTIDGNSSSRYTRLCDLPNLRNVYLPKSLSEIEQGYFLGAEKLSGIYLPEGTMFEPNKAFLPEKAKVIKHPDEKQVERVLFEPDEESAFLMEARSDYAGNRSLYPVKVGISHAYGELPKRLSQIVPENVLALYYTNGTKRVSREHTVDDYDGSYYVKGYDLSKFTNLESVYLPDSCRRIAAHQFRDCKKLRNIRFPDYLEGIGPYAFQDCISLEELECPKYLAIIDLGAFKGCSNLERVKFNEYIADIGMTSFMDCGKLEEVEFPDTIGVLGSGAFENCFRLREAILPRHVERSVENAVFRNCTDLELLVLPRKAKNVYTDLLPGCHNVKTIVIPSKETNIQPRTMVSKLPNVPNFVVHPSITLEDIENIVEPRDGKPHLVPIDPDLIVDEDYKFTISGAIKDALARDKKAKKDTQEKPIEKVEEKGEQEQEL